MEFKKRFVIQIGDVRELWLVLIGCGGTGSFLALHLARLAYHLRQRLPIRMLFVDPDAVEPKNLGRQNFCPAEVGEPKALCLMRRYNLAFGLDIEAVVAPFSRQVLARNGKGACAQAGQDGRLVVLLGAVDNPQARREIHEMLAFRSRGWLWWVDGGNHEHAGQVLLGDDPLVRKPQISPLGFCSGLPSPGLQHPELIEGTDLPPVRDASCADLLAADMQSLMINQCVAGWMATYLSRLVVSRDLDSYATYFDLQNGSVRSEYITEAT